MLVIWDTASSIPIKSIFNPHLNGVIAMDISPDALFIVTLSAPAPDENDNNEPQTISLWEWTHPEREEALFTSVIDEPDVQKVILADTEIEVQNKLYHGTPHAILPHQH